MSDLTREEVEKLIKIDKIIYEDIVWQLSHRKSYKFEVQILIEENYDVKLIGTANFLVDKYSYILLVDGTRVRAIDIGQDHHNPDCHNTGKCHYHKNWNEKDQMNYAKPLEIRGKYDLEHYLRFFLKECNITLAGNIVWPKDCQMEVLFYD